MHPAHGMVYPDVAVPLAEQSGLIGDIGLWLMQRACLDRKLWMGKSNDFGVSVNISVQQLMAADFPRKVARVLAETATEPALLTLEVTESVLVSDRERALTALVALKRLGVSIALDDFGTGQSSLSHLKKFPVDVLKIDRAFISDVENNLASRLIVRAVVGLAHGLGMSVVAEGVEGPGQRTEVSALACDFSQGYLFARPAPADDVTSLLAENSTLPRPLGRPTISVLAADGG
jgi:EAL domain-containing protein (putative c-di-GMP-specific phosphodiesterase class I)